MASPVIYEGVPLSDIESISKQIGKYTFEFKIIPVPSTSLWRISCSNPKIAGDLGDQMFLSSQDARKEFDKYFRIKELKGE